MLLSIEYLISPILRYTPARDGRSQLNEPRRYGVLLPHFGAHASRENLVNGARRIEAYGFDSVWVRDHLVFQPHGFEGTDPTHLEPFVVLAAIAAATDRLILGTGSLIPYRHPIHTANVIASLDRIAGPGRLLMGWGLGSFQHEFDAVGLGAADRKVLLKEQLAVIRELWTGEPVDHQGTYYTFAGVDVHPEPVAHVPIWYCGASPAAVRRAVEYCDGWIPGRMPLRDYRLRIERMGSLAKKAGRAMPGAGTIPFVVPARTTEEALRHIDVKAMAVEANRRYELPASGSFDTADDLDGALIYGTPEQIVAGVRRCQEAGATHFVFDLRLRFAEFEEMVALVGEEVLPELRRGDPAA